MATNDEERNDKGNQVTVAWTHIPIGMLDSKVKHRLDLKGGNPIREQELSTAEDAEEQGK